jgi:hypothetical protein
LLLRQLLFMLVVLVLLLVVAPLLALQQVASGLPFPYSI